MYSITIKNGKHASYNKIGLFFLLVHLLYFGYYFLKVNSGVNFVAIVGGIAISFLGLATNFNSVSRNRMPAMPFWLLLAALALMWAWLEMYLMSVVILGLGVLDFIARKKPQFIFTDDIIEKKAFPASTIRWEELDNVILKDNILTIDFKNDRLIQEEIDIDSYDIDEEAFNSYCAAQLGEISRG